MVMMAYPETLSNPRKQSAPESTQRVVYVYNSSQDNQWNFILKALIVVGAIIVLAYVAKKLFE